MSAADGAVAERSVTVSRSRLSVFCSYSWKAADTWLLTASLTDWRADLRERRRDDKQIDSFEMLHLYESIKCRAYNCASSVLMFKCCN